jgi:Zn-finger nucleic acid-binding protein
MRCPMCNVPMREVNRRGVLIDVCPECRGVWLDGGELDKLLTAGEQWESEYWQQRQHGAPPHHADPRHHGDPRYHGDFRQHGEYHHYPKKKKGFLGEVFDIFD